MEAQMITALGPTDPDDGDSGRQQRGMAIAAITRIEKSRTGYTVPSQSGSGSYTVSISGGQLCTCPDFQKHQQPCKHIYAVRFTIRREAQADGTTIETRSVKVTYGQDWAAYNAAQTSEKDTFMVLLADLCAGIPQPEHTLGRPRLPLGDMVYTGALKVYTGFSARRFDSDVRQAHRQGFIDTPPSFNSVNRYISDPDLIPVIKGWLSGARNP